MPSYAIINMFRMLSIPNTESEVLPSLPFWYGQEDVGRQTISLWVHTCEIKSYIPSNKCTYIVDCCKPILLSPRMEVPSLPMTLLGIVPPPKPLVIRPFSVTGGEAPSKISVGTRNGAMI